MKKRERVTIFSARVIIEIAVCTDSLQILFTPTILGGFLVSTLTFLGFWLWFKMHGVETDNSFGKLSLRFASMLASIFPGFNGIVPEVTLWALVIIFIAKLEDSAYNKSMKENRAQKSHAEPPTQYSPTTQQT